MQYLEPQQLGRIIIQKLKGFTGQHVVALARDLVKANDLGVPVREADYSKPQTLESALVDVHTLLLISSSEVGQRVTHHTNVIDAAKKVGVRYIVYTSALHADTAHLSLAKEHLVTEEKLKNSGIPFTILRNGWYTENYLQTIAGAKWCNNWLRKKWKSVCSYPRRLC